MTPTPEQVKLVVRAIRVYQEEVYADEVDGSGEVWRVDDALEDCEYAGVVVEYEVAYEVVIQHLREWLKENK